MSIPVQKGMITIAMDVISTKVWGLKLKSHTVFSVQLLSAAFIFLVSQQSSAQSYSGHYQRYQPPTQSDRSNYSNDRYTSDRNVESYQSTQQSYGARPNNTMLIHEYYNLSSDYEAVRETALQILEVAMQTDKDPRFPRVYRRLQHARLVNNSPSECRKRSPQTGAPLGAEASYAHQTILICGRIDPSLLLHESTHLVYQHYRSETQLIYECRVDSMQRAVARDLGVGVPHSGYICPGDRNGYRNSGQSYSRQGNYGGY